MLTQSNALPPKNYSARNRGKNKSNILSAAKNSKCFSKYRGNICLVIGTTVAIFLRYTLSLCAFLLVCI